MEWIQVEAGHGVYVGAVHGMHVEAGHGVRDEVEHGYIDKRLNWGKCVYKGRVLETGLERFLGMGLGALRC